MKLIHADFKKGEIRLRLDSAEDAYHLSRLIAQGDRLYAKAERKIKIGGEGEKGSVERKTITLEIVVEKTDLSGADLRILGITTQDHEDIPKGSHQGITLTLGDEARLTKDAWGTLERSRLEQATSARPASILAVVFDREEARIARLSRNGFEIIRHEKGDVTHKGYGEGKEDFFKTLAANLAEMDQQLHPNSIIIASPAFWKEYLIKELSPEIRRKAVMATVSSADETSFRELLARPELATTLANDRLAQEEKLLEEALRGLRAGMACYGQAQLAEAAQAGNLKDILVSEDALDPRQAGLENRGRIEQFLSDAEAVGARVHIITQEGAQRRLSPFSGILGILRWKIGAE